METKCDDLEILTRIEAAAYLRVCKATFDKLPIPRIKIRHRVLFKRSAIDQWLAQNTEIEEVEK